MQITLNKIPFDVRAVDGPLRAALLADPVVARGAARVVWEWNGAEKKGRFLAPTTPEKGLPVPTGMAAFVAKAGSGAVQKAEGPTQKMSERMLAAVGAKDWGQLMQAVARVTGVPQKKVPFEAFASLNDKGSYRIVMAAEFQVLELSNAARNLTTYVFLPGIVSFLHAMSEPVEGAPLPGSIRPAFVIPPGTQAAMAMRRMAVARRLTELQAELGETRPADLPQDDPRRAAIAKLGAEWKLLQPKKDAPKAA